MKRQYIYETLIDFVECNIPKQPRYTKMSGPRTVV